ncbi:MAG: hypothetical protein IJI96_01415 [Methanobrevibacter sp.]|nr:hypothetical protein [Methanobrevibacter sp.]
MWFFYVNEVIKNSLEKLWSKYGLFLNISKHLFSNYLQNNDLGFDIKINGLVKFDYPIPLNEFEDKKEMYFIEGNEKLKFLLNFD